MKRNVRERREKVSTLLLKNMTEVKIAETLGYARQTIVRDVSFFIKSTTKFLRYVVYLYRSISICFSSSSDEDIEVIIFLVVFIDKVI